MLNQDNKKNLKIINIELSPAVSRRFDQNCERNKKSSNDRIFSNKLVNYALKHQIQRGSIHSRQQSQLELKESDIYIKKQKK